MWAVLACQTPVAVNEPDPKTPHLLVPPDGRYGTGTTPYHWLLAAAPWYAQKHWPETFGSSQKPVPSVEG